MDPKDAALLLSSTVSVTSLILALLNARYQRTRDSTGDLRKLTEAVHEIQVGYAVLRAQADIYWSKTTRSTVQELISPHTPELDNLLRDLGSDRLPPAKLPELKTRLRRILDEETIRPGDSDERRAFIKRRRTLALDTLTLIEVRFEIPARFEEFVQAQHDYDEDVDRAYLEFEQSLPGH